MSHGTIKVDFHLHSYASNTTTFYAANAFAIPESYSEPRKLYDLLRARGMTLVTITDHNSIDGVRELLDAGLPDVFVSSEITTTFPEDGCKIHVTVANVTEAQFAEAKRLRGNVYEMIAWLDGEIAREAPGGNRIAYFMTHPLVSTENRPYGREGALSVEHVEKALLLCNCFEVHNGSRDQRLHDLTAAMLRSLDRATIERLADKHGIAPKGDAPWLKAIVGGSDDHSGINPGRTWTELVGPARAVPDANLLVEAMRRRETRPAGAYGGPITLANCVLKLLYEGSARQQHAAPAGGRKVALTGPIHSLLRLVFGGTERTREKLRLGWQRMMHRLFYDRSAGVQERTFEQVLESEVYDLLDDDRFRAELAATTVTDERIYLVVNTLVNRMFVRYAASLRASGSLNLVAMIKQVVSLASSNLFVSLPYLLSFMQQSADTQVARDVRKRFHLRAPQRVVLVTDTFFEINGVSASIRRMIEEATRRNLDFTVVTCVAAADRDRLCAQRDVARFLAAGRLKLFDSVVSVDFPEYKGMQVHVPPLLDLLKYVQESGFTKMQISTPGTIGLAGLLCAKLLHLETASTYHTAVPEYVENYTRDITLEALAWRYVIGFYHLVDEVVVPSRYIAKLLHKRGLRNRNLLTLDRWVDLERFHPRKRVAGYWRRYGVEGEEALVKFIYVGRLGVEKNLAQVAEAYRRLRATRRDAHLVIVGDGPYRAELERLLDGLPVTFTGFLEGEELPAAIASADAKLFPSTTDTWGNAPLEAQACGLPLVVSDVGGPAELMEPEVTGFRIPGRSAEGLYQAMVALMDGETRVRMGRAAREFAERGRVDEPFTAIFDAEEYRRRIKARPAAPSMQLIDLASVAFDQAASA